MKKILYIAVLVLTACACTKEIAEQQFSVAEASIVATHEDLTKVALDFGAASSLTWEDTDKIAVYDGTGSNEFSVKSGSNTGTSAVFVGNCDTSASTLYAVYPSTAFYGADGSGAVVSVPAAQVIPAGGTVDPKALVAVAYAAPGEKMQFKQVCGLVKFEISGLTGISEVVITGKGLAGEVLANSDGSFDGSSAVLENQITLKPDAGVFAPGVYYAAVLPGTTGAGAFTISYQYNNGSSSGSKTASGAVNVMRAKGVNAGIIDGFSKTTIIRDMPELFTWNANRVPDAENPETVYIAADIDMENEPWVPKDFYGTFDGQGHKLFNLNVDRSSNACFINSLGGTVKDVTFGSSTGVSYDGKSAIVQNNPDDDGASWRYAGLFTRLNAGAVLENVISYVPVTVAASSASKTRVGGLVGVVAGAAAIKGCENHGAVKNLASSPAANSGALGGLVGRADAAVSITLSANTGALEATGEGAPFIGGFIGADGAGSSIDGGRNDGSITLSASGSSLVGVSLGGFVGEAVGTTVSNAVNSGPITDTYNGEAKIGGIIGRINGADKPATMTGCTNMASAVISFSPASATKRAFIGGIVGNTPAAQVGTITVQNCENYASLSGSNEQICAIGGIVGYLNGKSVIVIKGCTNKGDIENTSAAAKNNTTAAEAFVSGIAAYLSTGMLAGSTIESCSNYGTIYTTNRNIKTIAGIIPLFQSSNAVSLKDCHNFGPVKREVNIKATIDADDENGNYYYCISGVAARVNLGAGCEISACQNHASGTVWANAAGGAAVIRIGGVAGYVVKCPEISSCINEAAVTYDNDIVQGSYIAIGGVAGHLYATPVFNACSNSGTVSSNRSQVNRIGGVAGNINNTAITNSTNTGKVILQSVTDKNWQSAGGIVGFAEGTAKAITGNVNRGAVEVQVSSTNTRIAVGGIVGMPATAFNVSGNRNYGAVTARNTSTTTPYLNVGGIVGQDDGATAAATITDNVNYGTVTNDTGNAGCSFAGGLYGNIQVSAGLTGSSFGAVNGVNAGAVAGKNSRIINATVCDAVTVNGVLKADASNEAVWLCPVNTGTITPTYQTHNSSE